MPIFFMGWFTSGFESGREALFTQQVFALMENLQMLRFLQMAGYPVQLATPRFMDAVRDNKFYEESFENGNRDSVKLLGLAVHDFANLFDLQHFVAQTGIPLVPWDALPTVAEAEINASRIDAISADVTIVDFAYPGVDMPPAPGSLLNLFNSSVRAAGTVWQIGPDVRGEAYRRWFVQVFEKEYRRNKARIFALAHHTWHISTIAVSGKWVDDAELEYSVIRKSLRPHILIRDLAATVLETRLKPPSLCFHWRRGDRGHAEMGGYGARYMLASSPARIVERVQGLIREHSLKSVFMMTNAGTAADIEYVVDHISGRADLMSRVSNDTVVVRIADVGVFPEWKNELKRMLVEQEICTHTDFFLAAGPSYWESSSPSRWIVEQRGLSGKRKPTVAYLHY